MHYRDIFRALYLNVLRMYVGRTFKTLLGEGQTFDHSSPSMYYAISASQVSEILWEDENKIMIISLISVSI